MSTDHQRASELLPWYVNATLGAREAALVEEHLRSCAECRRETAQLEALSRAVPLPEEEWAPSAAHFTRVMASVRAEEPAAPSLWQRLRAFRLATPRPVRFFVALQGAAVLGLLALVLAGPPRVYETLSRPEAGAPSQRARLHVVFAPDISESGMREVLQGAQAVIVDGPSPSGLYTIELPFPAAQREQAGEIASRIASQPKVRFAAPVAR